MASLSASNTPSIPAWKRLGLKLKNNSSIANSGSTNQVAIEIPLNKQVLANGNSKVNSKSKVNETTAVSYEETESTLLSTDISSPSKRKKAVSFASETKVADGDETERAFDEWAKQQKGGDNQFTQNQVAEFLPPKAHPANQKSKTTPKSVKSKTKERKPRSVPRTTAPQIPPLYVSYVQEFYKSRESWKFSKSKQTDLLKNSFNVFKVPTETEPALISYLEGLQGQAAKERLRDRAKSILQEGGDSEKPELAPKISVADMENGNSRSQAKEQSLRKQLNGAKQRLRNEARLDEEETEGFELKLRKRRRAELILNAIGGLTTPVSVNSPDSSSFTSGGQVIEIADESLEPSSKRRKSRRKRNVRTGVPEDDETDEASSVESVPSSAVSESEDDSGDDGVEGGEESKQSSSSSSSSSISGSTGSSSDGKGDK